MVTGAKSFHTNSNELTTNLPKYKIFTNRDCFGETVMYKALGQASVIDVLFSENEMLFHWFLVISFIWWFMLSVVVVLVSQL